jgi:hypothetical protein
MAVGYNPSIVSDGLVMYLDAANTRSYSGSGITVNSLTGGFGGSFVNGTGFSSANNGSFLFDGANDYINIVVPNLPLGASPRTVSIWFHTNSNSWLTDNRTLFEYGVIGGTFGVDMDSYPGMQIYTWGRDLQWNTTYALTGWKNIQVIYSDKTIGVYESGIFTTSATFADFINTPSTPVVIGRSALNPFWTSFNSYISQVQIYNRALTEQEILQNFNATRFRYGI